jgi:AraC-like DNA-binding protein
MPSFRKFSPGREHWPPGAAVPRHIHDQGYAAIVLAGAYEESGSAGRVRLGPGDVILHQPFDAHLDRFASRGAVLFNLALPTAMARAAIGTLADPDAILRHAETDPTTASALLLSQFIEAPRAAIDWPDLLAADILRNPSCRLDAWARAHCLAPATLSRGFLRVFGVTPAKFRSETRARLAFALIAKDDAALAGIATDAGFADQSHMTRAVTSLTGAPPASWRRGSNRFKTSLPRAV